MDPIQQPSRLLLDDPAGSRVRISEESLARLQPPAVQGEEQNTPSPKPLNTEGESVLVIDEPGGTRIRVRQP